MKNLGPKLEILANVAIICVAVLIAVVVYRERRDGTRKEPPQISVGASVPIKGVEWAAYSKTLVLGLSTQCHYCTESTPFYKELVAKLGGKKDIHLLAVLPQSATESRDHLERLGVKIEDIRQENLSSIQIPLTPTLLLVDERGRVVHKWTGKLRASEESDVLSAVGCKGPSCT